ncbi:MAG: hypothetical protein JWN46_3213 [Acidimicrobiales bacterium]|nr:hypothetical protein [Acidimicrobiales bacterium]
MGRWVVTAILSSSLLAGAAASASAGASPSGASLVLPASTAFAVLGHSCGGIRQQVLATGFDTHSGYPVGDVYLQTRCGTGGRGGHTVTYSAWVAATWDYAATVRSTVKLSGAPAGVDPTFTAVDAYGDRLTNRLTAVNVAPASCTVGNTTYCSYRAELAVVPPGTPTSVTAVQVGDQLRVRWTPERATAPLVAFSTVTAAPVGSTAAVLTSTAPGTATSSLIGPLEPRTTYRVTVTSTDAGGTSPSSAAIEVTTPVSTMVPSAPTGVTASWTAPQAPGDTLAAGWRAAVPGDSPIDSYQVTVSVSDPAPGHVTHTVPGSTLTAAFGVDDTLDWTVQVRAHNAAGWGAWSGPIVLPAA